jgi:hypothetical protein
MLLAISLTVAAIAALSIGATVFAATPDAGAAATCPLNGEGNGPRGGWLGVNTGDAVAKLLGLTPEQLQAERQAGKSLVQIAATKNVTQAQLVDAIMAAKKEAVQSRVAAGTLTQERANLMLQQMEQATNQAVTRTTIGQPEGRGGAGAMGRMGQSADTGVRGFGQGQGRAAR